MQVKDFNTLQQFFREHGVFSHFGVKRLGVFGSFARGEKFNDIDLLVDDRLNYEDRMTLKTFPIGGHRSLHN